jgi:hypothetical protein
LEERVNKKLMKKEIGKILVALVAVMLILSCIPSGLAFAEGTTATPVINTPIYAGATSVSGTSADSASISLTINNEGAQTATAGSSGNWTVTVPTLNEYDAISVTAQVYGENISQAAIAAVQAVTPTPSINTPIYAGATSVSGTSAGSASISLTVNNEGTKTVTADSNGNWTVTVPLLNTNDSIYVTAWLMGDAVSYVTTATVQADSIQTPTPAITTPIYAGAASVSGTSADNASISLTVNNGAVQTAPAGSSGNWTVTVPTLNTNDAISVTALVAGDTVSQAATATVQADSVQTPTPAITTPIYAGATSVSGTSADSASISLTVNNGAVQTVTAGSSGNWTVTVPALNTNGTISVTALVAGDTVSQAATATVQSMSTVPVFSDVPTSYWAYDAINSLSVKDIVSGYPDGTFKPDASITRAEFATMLVKALGLNTAGSTGQFTDVTTGDWCYGSVNTAVYASLTSGIGDHLFSPNDPITREQMAVMVAKALGTNAPAVDRTELNAFSDRSAVSSWAVTGMEDVVKAGILSGMHDGTLAPKAEATRAQAAAMIYKLLTVLAK